MATFVVGREFGARSNPYFLALCGLLGHKTNNNLGNMHTLSGRELCEEREELKEKAGVKFLGMRDVNGDGNAESMAFDTTGENRSL
jgi:hypothetical protein